MLMEAIRFKLRAPQIGAAEIEAVRGRGCSQDKTCLPTEFYPGILTV